MAFQAALEAYVGCLDKGAQDAAGGSHGVCKGPGGREGRADIVVRLLCVGRRRFPSLSSLESAQRKERSWLLSRRSHCWVQREEKGLLTFKVFRVPSVVSAVSRPGKLLLRCWYQEKCALTLGDLQE